MVCARARKRDIALASETVQLAALMKHTAKVLFLLCTYISSHNGFHWAQQKYTLNMVLGMLSHFRRTYTIHYHWMFDLNTDLVVTTAWQVSQSKVHILTVRSTWNTEDDKAQKRLRPRIVLLQSGLSQGRLHPDHSSQAAKLGTFFKTKLNYFFLGTVIL